MVINWTAKQSATGALKIASERAIQKRAEAIVDWISSKTDD